MDENIGQGLTNRDQDSDKDRDRECYRWTETWGTRQGSTDRDIDKNKDRGTVTVTGSVPDGQAQRHTQRQKQ